jgi:predicted glycoside hydrolase/deacetylase ChbG (UPF0249 family)
LAAGVTSAHLMDMLRRLPAGVTEVACHPGFADDLVTMYRAERQVELDTLCDPGVRRVLCDEGIDLIGFADLGAAG